MAYKKGHQGVEMEETDVENVAVGASSTQWGGKGAGSKAQAVLRADLKTDKNMTQDGPLGGTKYGGGTYTNKK